MRTEVETEQFGKVVVKYKGTKEDLIKRIKFYGSQEMFNKGYVKLFADPHEKVTKADVDREIDDKLVILNDILSKESLVFWLENLKTKKNGKFRKRSVAVIFNLENCSRFYEKEGMKWKVPRLQLEAISEDEVLLVFEERWESFL